MADINCVWYVSGFRRPWEAAAVGNIAAACKHSGAASKPRLQIYVDGGGANLRAGGVLSWKSLTFFERLKTVLFGGRLWHLWGAAPWWWGWVRLRARTVHISLEDSPNWRGHPTRLFEGQIREGESWVPPTFEVKVALAGDGGENARSSTLLLGVPPDGALTEALRESEIEGVPLENAGTDSLLKGHAGLLAGDDPSSVLLAAYLTMQGVPVIGKERDMPLLRSILGPEGFITPAPCGTDRSDREGREMWKKILGDAASEAGRTASASARRFLKANYPASSSAESLEGLYRSILYGGKDPS